jgi:hypothetical protein
MVGFLRDDDVDAVVYLRLLAPCFLRERMVAYSDDTDIAVDILVVGRYTVPTLAFGVFYLEVGQPYDTCLVRELGMSITWFGLLFL